MSEPYSAKRCLKSCQVYHQTTSCSCGQPGDPDYRQKRPNEDLDASEEVYMETQSRVVELRAQLRRLRISQLRRMRECAMDRRGFAICYLSIRDAKRWDKLIDAIEREIERLRGEG